MVRKVYLFLSHPKMVVELLELHPLGFSYVGNGQKMLLLFTWLAF